MAIASAATGTVHKTSNGGYDKDRYRSLFAGFMPVSSPRLVGVVVIDGPRGDEHYGGLVAAPVFGSVMQEAARILNLQADDFTETEAAGQFTAQTATPLPNVGNAR
jgi:cell division protein FtsI (penicillin-binding protein 3)